MMTFRAQILTAFALLQAAGALLLASPSKALQKGSGLHADISAEAPLVVSAAAVSNKTEVKQAAWTFPGWYNAYAQGRGIWKWSNAVSAYQQHLVGFIGQPIHLAEIGVQSGGSLTMWRSVLGAQCYLYGLDINPESLKFQDASTTIVIGDQEDRAMWQHFFAHTVKAPLSALIDDGGHTPGQMLVTLQETFAQMTPNGVVAIEDIHGLHYVDSFFAPAADFLGTQAAQSKVGSVHVYPFLLVASREQAPAIPLLGPSTTVASMNEVWNAISQNPGGHIILPYGVTSFLNAPFIKEIFTHFGSLHDGGWTSIPDGCHATADPVCTVRVQNTPLQNTVLGVHIYSDKLIVDVAPSPPVIEAVRHGTEWVTSSVEASTNR